MLSLAAFREGRHAQAFPSFGSERTGAPVVAFCRIAEREIRLREPVMAPAATAMPTWRVTVSSTGVGVFLNTLTIMASFGALMVARHQGVFSIGAVMSLGMVACQFAFILVLPAILNLWGDRRRD